MSKQEYNNQLMTQYLLGSLPEAETARLDDLSFTDEEFAAALETTEQDLVDAYTQDELTGAALEKFKLFYLASPLRREKVNFARALRTLAEKDAAAVSDVTVGEEKLAGASGQRKSAGWFSALSFWVPPRPAVQWGFAALSCVLLVAGVRLAFENMRLREQSSRAQAEQFALVQRARELQSEVEGQRATGAQATAEETARARAEREHLEQELRQRDAQTATTQTGEQRRAPATSRPAQAARGGFTVASFILTPQMRGTAQLPTISLPAGTESVSMRLELEPNDYRAYRVTLRHSSIDQIIWHSGTLKARTGGDTKSLGVRFSAKLLQPQTYTLRVEGMSAAAAGATEIVSDYPFRVMK